MTSTRRSTCLGGTRPASCCWCRTSAGVAHPLLIEGSRAAAAPRAALLPLLLLQGSTKASRLLVLDCVVSGPKAAVLEAAVGVCASAEGGLRVKAVVPSMPAVSTFTSTTGMKSPCPPRVMLTLLQSVTHNKCSLTCANQLLPLLDSSACLLTESSLLTETSQLGVF